MNRKIIDRGLIDTLQELVELDPLKVKSVRELCALYDEDGKVDASLKVWQAIDRCLWPKVMPRALSAWAKKPLWRIR